LFVGDPDPGLFCQYPAQAQVGVNVTPTYTSESFWYTFTMPENNKKLVISRLTNPLAYYRSVGVISDCNRTQIYGYGEDGIEITGLAAGETVLIFWSDLATGQRPQAEWNLSISDPGIGDACENSKEALPGLNYCSGAPTWYSYTLPRTGNIRLSSKETVWYADTNLEVYDGCNGSLIASNDNLDESNLTSEALIENVEAGQTIWIRWVTNHPFQTPFDWKLTVEGVVNSAPVLEDVSFHIVTTPTNGQILGVLLANDADNDVLQYRITHGNEDGVFELTSTTGVLSFADVSKIPHNGISRELEITVTDKIAITTAMAKIDVITSFPGDENEDITVFPNPTTDCIYVRVPAQIDSFYCTLVDVNGKPVKTFPLNEHKLSVPGIASGNYFIKVHSSSRVDVVRVVVVQ
jgi:hypothetical protein